jgi:hypothetical protein
MLDFAFQLTKASLDLSELNQRKDRHRDDRADHEERADDAKHCED